MSHEELAQFFDELAVAPGDVTPDSGQQAVADALEPTRGEGEGVVERPEKGVDLELPRSSPDDESRYHLGEELGRGGVGRVYRAFDRRLQREVALKFLDAVDGVSATRFALEAQRQARIDHPNVCKVFEVGSLGERPFIAMQLIEGHSLSLASEGLPLEQKVRLLIQVAQGIHAANRQGLVHRDIKPSNILVEECDDGVLIPYVMDFGIALDIGGPRLTRTGSSVGTPYYMAPEQVRGAIGLVDRRTDVYGLGVTMYRILTGKLPFDSEHTVEILNKVLDDEPVPPSRLNPSLPRQLESVILKCLEKEPHRRYGSAKELAFDLQRFLDGDPVEARPTSWAYRLIRRLQKHRTVTVVVSVALLVVLALGVTNVRARFEASEQARLAQRLGREVERIEWLQRAAHQLPLHDLTSHRDRIRQQIESIRSWARQAGPMGEAAADYAMGKGLLALDDPHGARSYLESAFRRGYDGPEVASALADVLSRIYLEEVRLADRIPDDATRASRNRQLEADLLQPARELFARAADVPWEAPELFEGRLAFFARDFDRALELAEQARQAADWLYESYLLEGDVFVEIARAAAEKHEHDRVEEAYGKGVRSLQQGLAIGRSDPTGHTLLCDLYTNWLRYASWNWDKDPRPLYDQALASCDRAILVAPDRIAGYRYRSRLQYTWAEHLDSRGQDPQETIDLSLADASRVLHSDPQSGVLITAGDGHSLLAQYAYNAGADPTSEIEAAIANFEAMLEIEPRHIHAHHSLANLYSLSGRASLRARSADRPDPVSQFEAAQRYLEASAEIDPQNATTYALIGNLSVFEGSLAVRRGEAPASLLERGQEAFERAYAVDPNLSWILNNLASLHLARGRDLFAHGQDPRAVLSAAIESAERALTEGPDDAFPYFNIGEAHRDLARLLLAEGADPLLEVEEGLRQYRLGLELRSQFPGPFVDLGRLNLIAAEFLVSQGQSPLARTTEARRLLDKALEIDPDKYEAMREVARSHWLEARWQAAQGKTSEALQTLQRAGSALTSALEIDPEDALTHLELARCAWLRFIQERVPKGSTTSSGMATLDEALEHADRALELKPDLAEALALRGDLIRRRGRIVGDSATAVEGEVLIHKAIEQNRYLARDWKSPAL